MKKINCSNCNELIVKNSKYCLYCGFENQNLTEETVPIKNKSIIKFDFKYFIGPIITLILCCGLFYGFYNYYLKNLVKETTKIVKDVTITESGISASVNKVYDSVVVVETYINDQAYGTGTGFVFKTDDKYGYLLTNNHVIANSTEIYVTLTNDERIKAKLVGTDEYSDIAVLSIDKEKVLAIASIGSSKDLNIGDTLFTVGAPVDSETYSGTVTRGILSGKERLVEVNISNSNSTYVMEVLQTDAAINSGNSGGPLCNSNGEVIGITNMKLASSQIESMGFAIPIDTAIEYANMFIDGTPIVRPYVGVSLYTPTSSMFFSIDTIDGAYINSVEKKSPADKAGLQKGDIITKIEDIKVSDASYFKYLLYKYNVGDTIKVTYKRNDKEYTTKITLSSYNQAT